MMLCPQAWPTVGSAVVLGADHDRKRARSHTRLHRGGQPVPAALHVEAGLAEHVADTLCGGADFLEAKLGFVVDSGAEPDLTKAGCPLRPDAAALALWRLLQPRALGGRDVRAGLAAALPAVSAVPVTRSRRSRRRARPSRPPPP